MKKFLFAGFVVLSFALPTAAFAQSADEGYTNVPASDPTLPFTGLELGGIAAAGLVLLAMGLVLRRRAHAK